MADARLVSIVDAPCGSHSCQHSFRQPISQKCVLFQKFLVSLESFDTHSLRVAVIPLSQWSALNTPKPLCVLKAKLSGDYDGQSTEPPRPIHCSPKVWFRLSDNAEKMRWCPNMHEPHVLTLMNKHICLEYCYIIKEKLLVNCTCSSVR